ncbi:hypothetical protein [Thalassospira tepidiphila]|uniref:hypothetical protein n=1 Tax=Thalassospira tepidiphila TaxID=393657 RepID=UPI0030C6AD5F
MNELDDKVFEPWDVSFNAKSDLLELDLFRKLLEENPFETPDDLVGVFSWKFLKKSGVPYEYLMAEIAKARRKEVDAIVLNPVIASNALFANGLEQGVVSGHRGFNVIFPKLELAPVMKSLLPVDTFCMSSYVVAKRSFWRDLVRFLDLYLGIAERIAKADEEFKKVYFGSAGYYRNPKLDHRPFLVERLVQLFLNTRIYNVHYLHPTEEWLSGKFGDKAETVDRLYHLKRVAQNNSLLLKEWMQARHPIVSTPSRLSEFIHRDDPKIEL